MLDTILDDAREALAARRAARGLAELRERAVEAPPVRSLEAALRGATGMAVIAEVKRRSPSAGMLAEDVDPVARARAYERGGAAAASVLTDAAHFGGSLDDLTAIRAAGVGIPLLRKDFILDEYGVVEARAAGADALLLIAGALDDRQLGELLAVAAELGMDALVEVHDAAELDRVLATPARLVGINNRDLTSFETSLDATLQLAPRVPADRLVVSESAISSPEHVRQVREAGARAVLVGTALMRSGNPADTIAELAGA
jgi:indole-3-glycerol phosphate synthase